MKNYPKWPKADMNYDNYPYEITLLKEHGTIVNPKAFDWLEDNISQYNELWTYTGWGLRFKHEKDLIFFTLRWT